MLVTMVRMHDPVRKGRRTYSTRRVVVVLWVRSRNRQRPQEAVMTQSTPRSSFSVEAIRDLHGRLAALVRDAPDPSVAVPHTDRWSLTEVMAHLATVAVRYSPAMEPPEAWARDAQDVAALNDSEIAGMSERPLPEIMAELHSAVTALPAGPQIDAGPSVSYTGGTEVRPPDLLGILLGEFLIHGRDIAQVLQAPWPIDPMQATEVIASIAPIMPAWVDPVGARGLTATFEVRIRGDQRYRWQFQDGILTVGPPIPGSVDVTISAAPVALLLTSYRRLPLWRPILTGQLRAWGRRPMLAFKVNSYFRAP
jgi:uncharacterized protein (TIGR03083 family)